MAGPISFPWPHGKRAAMSLTFDDARFSQLDHGLPILNRYGVRATFYVSPPLAGQRLDDWRGAVVQGHEIGNHTLTHPCSGNFLWSRDRALEDYTLARMEQEISGASAWIEEHLGVCPTSFAYPCGQSFLGRGAACRSYVPLVEKHFVAGRGFRNEAANDPRFCDLAYLCGVDADGQTFDALQLWLTHALESGGWLVLAAHDVGLAQGAPAHQKFYADALEVLCQYVQEPAAGFWVDTVATVGSYIREIRVGSERS